MPPEGRGEPQPPRELNVPAARLPAWLTGFERRHGQWHAVAADEGWSLVGADGATAMFAEPRWLGAREAPEDLLELPLVALRLQYGVLLVRRAAYAVAAVSNGKVVASHTSNRHIHGRTAAGGWSQKRYARRRDNQAAEIVSAAAGALAEAVAGLKIEFLATGGDRALVDAALALIHPGVATGPHLAIGNPDRELVREIHDLVTSVRISLTEPPG